MDSINFKSNVLASAESSNESDDSSEEFASISDRVTLLPKNTSASNRSQTRCLYGSISQNSKAPTTSSRSDGFSPLHSACADGNIDTVQTLLVSGADVNVTSATGSTPLHLACYKGYTDVVELLVKICASCEE
jgi:ankyrin repeat protein